MATRLTYTSGTRTPELDAAFERCLETARADAHDPLPHVVGESERTDGAEFAREDPSRAGEIASRAREAPDALVDEAVAVPAEAQRDWRALAVAERCTRLRAAADVIRERVLEMAAVVTLETGKPGVESIAEVEEAVGLIETYCAQIEQHDGFEVPLGTLSPGERNRTSPSRSSRGARRQPGARERHGAIVTGGGPDLPGRSLGRMLPPLRQRRPNGPRRGHRPASSVASSARRSAAGTA